MNKLELNRPSKRNGESVLGYMNRLAEANATGRINWLIDLPEEMSIVRQAIGTVLHGRLPSGLAKGPLRTSGGDFDSSYILRSSARCCPECLKEDNYWRSEWEHEFYVVCHLHRNVLIDRCPQCATELTWKRPSLMHCTCGSSMITWDALAGSQDCFEISECLVALLAKSINLDFCCPQNTYWKSFGNLDAVSFSALIRFFGKVQNLEPENLRLRLSSYTDIRQSLKTVGDAAIMLINWPKRFRFFLEYHAGYSRGNSAGLCTPKVEYVRMVDILKGMDSTRNLELVLSEFREFIFENWAEVVDEKNKWKNQVGEDAEEFISGMMASRRLNISPSLINDLLRKNLLVGDVEISKKNNYVSRRVHIIRRSLKNIEDFVGDQVTLQGMADLMGVPKYRLSELVAAQLIFPIVAMERKGYVQRFSREKIRLALMTIRA